MSKPTDTITRQPDITGRHGRAWRVDIDAATKPGQPAHAQIALWIVEAAWANPLWHSYMLSLTHLRPMPDERPTITYVADASHEILLYALDPDAARDPVIAGDEFPALLTPCNFAAQLAGHTDDAASERVLGTVREIVDGVLSPDTDFLHEWVARFGQSMIKPQYKEAAH